MTRPVVFLTDYGLDDEFVGVCHGVMARIAPAVMVIDLTHAIPPQDVLRGALVLARSVVYLPADSILLAVVDPGVGTSRRAVAVEAGGRILVGPDNGLLSLAWQEAGGVSRAVEIVSDSVVLKPVSRTFHGRDVFAPAAAHLAMGKALEELGPTVDPGGLITVAVAAPNVEPGRVDAEVLGVDRFGNVLLSARPSDLESAGMDQAPHVEVRTRGAGGRARRATTFGDVGPGELAVIVGSTGRLSVVVNRGSAAEQLGLVPGDPVSLWALPSG